MVALEAALQFEDTRESMHAFCVGQYLEVRLGRGLADTLPRARASRRGRGGQCPARQTEISAFAHDEVCHVLL